MITFYLAMRHARADEVYKHIDDYCTSETKYVISTEKCKNTHKETYGEHFHVVIEWDDKHYTKFKRDVITKLWKLKGQAKDGVGRQYGKENVGDEDAMISYILKDQDWFDDIVSGEVSMLDWFNNTTTGVWPIRYQGYTPEYLIERYKESFKKEDKYTQIENVINHLKMMPCATSTHIDIWKVQRTILLYWMDNHTNVITKSTLNHITIKFITQEFKYYEDNDLDRILLYILGKGI